MNGSSDRIKGSGVLVAVGAILMSVFALSAGDAIIKLTSTSFPIWQIYVLRSLLVVPVLLVFLRRRGPGISLIPASILWVLLRSILLVAMWVAYYTALPEIDLSLAAAAYYTSPLLIVLLSSRLTGDRVYWSVCGAVALGFAGVLVMLVGSIFAAVAYQIGPAPVVATFDYSYLVFASVWGALLFAEIPDPVTLVGMIMIAVGGVLAVRGGRG